MTRQAKAPRPRETRVTWKRRGRDPRPESPQRSRLAASDTDTHDLVKTAQYAIGVPTAKGMRIRTQRADGMSVTIVKERSGKTVTIEEPRRANGPRRRGGGAPRKPIDGQLKALLAKHPQLSDAAIARKIRVSRSTVRRRKLEFDAQKKL